MYLFEVINNIYKMSVLGKCDCCFPDCCSKYSTEERVLVIIYFIIASVFGTAIATSFYVGVGLYLFHSSKRMIGLLLVIISGSVLFLLYCCCSDIGTSIFGHLGDCCIYLWNCSSRVRQCWQDRRRVHSHASVR